MNINLVKPNKENLTSFVSIGSFLFLIGFFDFFINTFFNWNLTGFLPDKLSYFTPLIFGIIGFYLIRIEFSGNKLLDKINTNFNSSNLNAALTLIIIFTLIKFIPSLLNWFIFDADFMGNTKQDCTSSGACWVFVKVWLNRFIYGMYPDAEQWRINTAFFILFGLVGASFFVPAKFKKYILIFLLFVIFTFGIGRAWAVVRYKKFYLGTLSLENKIDLAQIKQSEVEMTGATGEGMSDFLDVEM